MTSFEAIDNEAIAVQLEHLAGFTADLRDSAQPEAKRRAAAVVGAWPRRGPGDELDTLVDEMTRSHDKAVVLVAGLVGRAPAGADQSGVRRSRRLRPRASDAKRPRARQRSRAQIIATPPH